MPSSAMMRGGGQLPPMTGKYAPGNAARAQARPAPTLPFLISTRPAPVRTAAPRPAVAPPCLRIVVSA
jgi:hypothetical protein